MQPFEITIEIKATPDCVWEVLAGVERWPEWTRTVTSVQRLDGGPLTVGSRVLIRQPKLLPAKWQVTELDHHNRTFTWVTSSPGLKVTARHAVESIVSGCRVTLSVEFSGLLGPLMARLTRKLNQEYLGIEARGLKERSEA